MSYLRIVITKKRESKHRKLWSSQNLKTYKLKNSLTYKTYKLKN